MDWIVLGCLVIVVGFIGALIYRWLKAGSYNE